MGQLVTVIIPVHNAKPFLERTVGAVLAQTYPDFQLVLVDDGSTDGSTEMINGFLKADSRVQAVFQSAQGVGSAQNAGLDAATGDLITFCDHDDFYHPQYLEILVAALENTNSDIAKCRWLRPGLTSVPNISFQHYEAKDVNITELRDPLRAYQTVFSRLLRFLARNDAIYFNEANWGKLYRAALFDGVRFPVGQYAQDISVAGSLLSQAQKVVDVALPLYFWVQHSGSISHNRRNFQFLADNIAAASKGFDLSIQLGVVPYRSYFMLRETISDIVRLDGDHRAYVADIRRDYLARMPHRARADALFLLRHLENRAYNLFVHSRS
ncbi:MAG: glycosyltransferase [Propionibacteriaceae bacterium]|nr:glycosyltransferase [Propionibacteriaceae bacterium]